MDSTGSSILSATTSVMVEDIIRDMGDPEDHSERSCEVLHNIFSMYCTKPFPNQQEMYDRFVQNKYGLAQGSVASLNRSFDIDEEDSRLP